MIHFTILFIILSTLFACGKLGLDIQPEDIICKEGSHFFLELENKTFISPNKGHLIYTPCLPSTLPKVDDFIDLSFKEVCIIQQNIKGITSSLTNVPCAYDLDSFNLDNYHYQFLGLKISGEVYIYINAFVRPKHNLQYANWKTEPINFCDDDEGYWNALFAIETKEFSHFQKNLPFNKAILPIEQGPNALNQCTRPEPKNITDFFQVDYTDFCKIENSSESLQEILSDGYSRYFQKEVIADLSIFHYQYMDMIQSGQKVIYINAYYSAFNSKEYDFRKIARGACDGGPSFWRIIYDLESEIFRDLVFNNPR